ncbi:MAG: hypothetical protein N2170_09885 [Bacteroidia bacterium]|nr:hypothetical protein [Bacteroidia bacterium]
MHRFFSIGLLVCALSAQTTSLINGTAEGSFEGAGTFCSGSGTIAGWTVVNGNPFTADWAVGSQVGAAHGNNSIFIAINAICTQAGYPANPSYFHFYRDITLPTGQPHVKLTLKLQGSLRINSTTGERADILRVFLAFSTYTPSAGSDVSSSYWIANFFQLFIPTRQWRTFNIPLNCLQGGQTYRLIFTYVRTNVTASPPSAAPFVAIDSIAAISSYPGFRRKWLLGEYVHNCSYNTGTGSYWWASL